MLRSHDVLPELDRFLGRGKMTNDRPLTATPESIGNWVADMDFTIEETTRIIKVLLDYIADFEG